MKSRLFFMSFLMVFLSGCVVVPWNEGMCPETDKKLRNKKMGECFSGIMNQNNFTSSEVLTNHLELVSWHCKGKSEWRECKSSEVSPIHVTTYRK